MSIPIYRTNTMVKPIQTTRHGYTHTLIFRVTWISWVFAVFLGELNHGVSSLKYFSLTLICCLFFAFTEIIANNLYKKTCQIILINISPETNLITISSLKNFCIYANIYICFSFNVYIYIK